MSTSLATAPASSTFKDRFLALIGGPRGAYIVIGAALALMAAILLWNALPPRVPHLPEPQARNLGLQMAEAARVHDNEAVLSLLKQGANPDQPSLDGSPALLWAAHFADDKLVKQLLRYGASTDATNRFGMTALQVASSQGDAIIAERLLEAGAAPDKADDHGVTPLMMAAQYGSEAIVDQLLDAGAKVDLAEPVHGVTALMLAGWYAHPDVVKRLLKSDARVDLATKVGPLPKINMPNPPGGGSHGDGIVRGGIPPQGARPAIPGGMTPLLYAARGGSLDAVKALVDAGAPIERAEANSVRPLLMAILNDRMDIAAYLIDRGANVNAADWWGRTPLFAAVDIRNVELATDGSRSDVDREAVFKLIQTLLDRKADPNARVAQYYPTRNWIMQGGSLSWVDFTGQTAFIRAALSGDVETMRLLLKHGADPNIPTFRGTTALMAAAGVNWQFFQTFDEGEDKLLEAIKMCRGFGQDVNAENSMKVTALMGAANRGSDKIVKYLVDQGARLDAMDDQGRTPLTWAQGVFLATLPATTKTSTVALLTQMCAERGLKCEGRKPVGGTGAAKPPPPGRTGGLGLAPRPAI